MIIAVDSEGTSFILTVNLFSSIAHDLIDGMILSLSPYFEIRKKYVSYI